MAEALTDQDDDTALPETMNHNDCINHTKIFSYGWESLYKQHLMKLIEALDIHSDASRLFLLLQFDSVKTFNVSDTLLKLSTHKLCQLPEAILLTTNLKDIMPDACPIYLDIVGEVYAHNHTCLSEYIELVTTKKKSYPKLQQYNERVKNLNIIKSLTVDFNVENFLSMCPDPINYFKNAIVNPISRHEEESVIYLCEKFPMISKVLLRAQLIDNKYNLTMAVEALQDCQVFLKRKRKSMSNALNLLINYFKASENIEYLKEIAYLDHKDEILNHIETEKAIRKIKVEEAKAFGRLNYCQCCFNGEVLDCEINCCPVGHYFCSSCIKSGVEVAVGEGKLEFKCFAVCTEEFSLDIVKTAVDKKLYERVVRLQQAQEIMNARIEGLETCAFCDYSVILSADFKTINCQNPDCKKETCRQCREESHFPLKCDEIEKLSEVKIRTMIEDKMTEVLIRTCYYCKRKFVKDDGCNKMTCTCGKEMCYICRQPINDSHYSHFYHTQTLENKCPLYTDENLVHATAVEAAARLIVNELREKKPELLRHIDIDKILPELKKKTLSKHVSALDANRVVATVIGQNIEDVNNLKDMRSLEPRQKKVRR